MIRQTNAVCRSDHRSEPVALCWWLVDSSCTVAWVVSVEVVDIVPLVMMRPTGIRESVGANGDDGANWADGAAVVSAEDGQSRGRKSSCWSMEKAVLAVRTPSIWARDMCRVVRHDVSSTTRSRRTADSRQRGKARCTGAWVLLTGKVGIIDEEKKGKRVINAAAFDYVHGVDDCAHLETSGEI